MIEQSHSGDRRLPRNPLVGSVRDLARALRDRLEDLQREAEGESLARARSMTDALLDELGALASNEDEGEEESEDGVDAEAFPSEPPTGERPILRDDAVPGPLRTIEIGPRARWYRWEGRVVSLERRRALRGILGCLAAVAPEPASGEAIVAAGWPEERVLPAAAASRVRTAIATLRRLGLRDILLTTGDGYRIDANVVVHGQL